MRKAGVLLPISSLPSKYGIGSFSKEAYDFVDWLVEAGQSYWQILPLVKTEYGNSPYQSPSAFAGNHNLIDLEAFVKEGIVTEEELSQLNFGDVVEDRINYEKLIPAKEKALKLIYDRVKGSESSEYHKFLKYTRTWIDNYGLYMAVREYFDHAPWYEWDMDIRMREPQAMERYAHALAPRVHYYKFIQYIFYKQWFALKEYANDRGIKIIGDLPIYVSLDSADVWAEPEEFMLDENMQPISVAGCPPDAFSDKGQLWGNPIYNWEHQKANGYGWWIRRIDYHYYMYDIVRLDHFRAFDEYYAVPYGDKTAENGEWRKGPGIEFFNMLKGWFGELRIIAEDLGMLTDSVRQLVKDTGFPGMKVLQFAFDVNSKSSYLPIYYEKNCVVYTGTHDNNTVLGWYMAADEEERQYIREYVAGGSFANDVNENNIAEKVIVMAYASAADTVIVPMQDVYSLKEDARINVPGTVGDNWEWRMDKTMFDIQKAKMLKKLCELYDR